MVNLLSGSLVVMALSSALVGARGAEVVRPVTAAAGVRVQLGESPVAVGWPRSDPTAYVDVDLTAVGGGSAVMEGLQRVSAVEACSAPWTRAGACPGRQLRLEVARDGRLSGALLDAPLAHLKVTAGSGGPHADVLVLRAAASA
jgi:hypothetical protein